jgi:hypothetical protein
MNNGRVNIKTPATSDLFKLYDKIPAHQCATYRNATEGIWSESSLSAAYFSHENIQILQNGIRAGVYHRSKGKFIIGPQDCDELKVVMRSVFLQNSKNLPSNIPQQIAALNQMVLDYCIQQVYGEAIGYMKYIDDVSSLAVPIAHPVMTDNTDRELEFKSWF